jgi:hypothetical protein
MYQQPITTESLALQGGEEVRLFHWKKVTFDYVVISG